MAVADFGGKPEPGPEQHLDVCVMVTPEQLFQKVNKWISFSDPSLKHICVVVHAGAFYHKREFAAGH